MNKEHNFVTCQSCEWQLNNQSDRDWEAAPCMRCKNTRKIIDPAEILCNLCGGCMCPLGTMNEQIPHGLYDTKVTGGYNSYHLFDLNTYIFSFCEKCLRQLFMQCKIKPTIYDTNMSSGDLENEYTWEADQSGYEEQLWQDSDAPHQAYLAKKCNYRKDCPNDAKYSIFYDYEEVGLKFSEKTCCEAHKNGWANGFNVILKPYVSDKLKPFL